ncbi:MAG TPA: tetratricopeptide repeat protein [Gemmatimonadaceae bacterium]
MCRKYIALTMLLAPTYPRLLPAQCSAPVERLISGRSFDRARVQLETVLARAPADDRAMNCMGRLLIEEDRPAVAVEWLEKALAISEKSADHHLVLALALKADGAHTSMLRAPGLVRRMRSELETAIALDPNVVESRFVLAQYYAQAPGFLGGNVAKARAQAIELMRLSMLRGQIVRGIIAEQAKDYATAEREYLAAIAAQPDSDVAYGVAAGFYRRRERWADAIAMSERQVKSMPNDAPLARVSTAHYSLGQACERAGDRQRARKEYEAALKANPDNATARKALGGL